MPVSSARLSWLPPCSSSARCSSPAIPRIRHPRFAGHRLAAGGGVGRPDACCHPRRHRPVDPLVIGFANVVAAQLYGDGLNFALVCVIVGALAIVIGALNGLISRGLDIHPLIVTLGIGMIVQAPCVCGPAAFPSGSAPQRFQLRLDRRLRRPLPVPALGALRGWCLHSCGTGAGANPYGRRLYAVGSNRAQHHWTLIDPIRMWTLTYAASAFFAAAGGVLLLGFTGSAYGDVGQPYLFQTIAAVVSWRRSGRRPRQFFRHHRRRAGATEINTLLIGLGFQPSTVQATLGLVIVLLVSLYGRERHVSATDLSALREPTPSAYKFHIRLALPESSLVRSSGRRPRSAHASPPPRSRGRRQACTPASLCPRRRGPSRNSRSCVRHRGAGVDGHEPAIRIGDNAEILPMTLAAARSRSYARATDARCRP